MATVITIKAGGLEKITAKKKRLPKSWFKAEGLMRHKGKDMLRHLEKVRREWR